MLALNLQLVKKIEAWHKVEFLTPFQFQWDKDEDYLIIEERQIPWIEHEKYRLQETKDDTFRFTVYLGVMDTEVVMQLVRKLFHDKEQIPEDINYKTNTAIAEISLDFNGNYIAGSFKLSTLPFALAKLKKGNLYKDWYHEFNKLHVQLNEMIERELKSTVTLDRMKFIQEEISDFVGWSTNYSYFIAKCRKVPKPRQEDKEQSSSVREPGILNSFYIKDLELVRKTLKSEGSISNGLIQFLSGEDMPLENRQDIHRDKEKLFEILSPKNIPLGKWPGNPEHSLNLMQQAAVNLIFKQLHNSTGIFSVNGPPGTGKTTLLRDVIAEIMVQRAERLVAYDDPKKAFSFIKEADGSIKKVQNSYVNTLSPELCGFGIVVASSNNGAVENISKELPDNEALHKSFIGLEGADYFRDIAQRMHGPNSWGLISAVLGNSVNRYSFTTNFLDREKDKDTIGKSYFQIHDECKAIPDNVHLEKWNKARELFEQALRNVQDLQQEAIELYELCKRRNKFDAEIDQKQDEILCLTLKMEELKEKRLEINRECSQLDEKIFYLKEALDFHNKQKISFFIKLFRCKTYRDHTSRSNLLNKDISEQFLFINQKKADLNVIEDKLALASNHYTQLNQELTQLKEEFVPIESRIKNSLKEKPRVIVSLKDLIYGDKDEIQKSSPFITQEFSEARSKLFLAAMHVHECFVRASVSKIIGNVILFSKLNSLDTFAEKEVFKPIWDVISLIIPVVSTSFASVSSMFRGVGSESLGWLIVDEAGQAVPQASVGAIWRSQRTVVVGDPIQIEPVVTLPKSVFDDIRKYFEVSSHYLSNKSSVQTLMDLANKYGTFLQNRWIGSPLWVHRRCINPMFTVCNEIAYDDNMVLATENPEEKQAPLKTEEEGLVKFLKYIGPSSWYHVEGETDVRQYVPAQGKLVFELVKKAFQYSNGQVPSLFIISPFTAVKEELKSLLKNMYKEVTSLKIDRKQFHKWINESVGTVHTFQGKEASVVIFCLGVDHKNRGSASWATEQPNLINVAVSRAKYRFYVVGDMNIWGALENMKVVKRELTYKQPRN